MYVVPQGWFMVICYLLLFNIYIPPTVYNSEVCEPDNKISTRETKTKLDQFDPVSITTTISASCCFDPEFLCYLLNITFFYEIGAEAIGVRAALGAEKHVLLFCRNTSSTRAPTPVYNFPAAWLAFAFN